MSDEQERQTEPESVLLPPDTVGTLREHSSAERLEDAVAEAAEKSIRYDNQIDFKKYRLVSLGARFQQEYNNFLFNLSFRVFFLVVIIAITATTAPSWVSFALGGIYIAVFILPMAPRFSKLRQLVTHLDDLGLAHSLDDYMVLLEAHSSGEAIERLSDVGEVSRNEDRHNVIYSDDSAKPSSETPEDADPVVWVSESAFEKIDQLREENVIQTNTWLDEIFKEVRLQKARKEDPTIELEDAEVLKLVNELNLHTDGGMFAYREDSTGRYRKLVHTPEQAV